MSSKTDKEKNDDSDFNFTSHILNKLWKEMQSVSYPSKGVYIQWESSERGIKHFLLSVLHHQQQSFLHMLRLLDPISIVQKFRNILETFIGFFSIVRVKVNPANTVRHGW